MIEYYNTLYIVLFNSANQKMYHKEMHLAITCQLLPIEY